MREFDLLNRVGAVRLLDAISCVCKNNFICHNWKVIKSNICNPMYDNVRSNAISNRESSSHVANMNIRESQFTRFKQNRNQTF